MWILSPTQRGKFRAKDSSERSVSLNLTTVSFFAGFINANSSLSVACAFPIPLLLSHETVRCPPPHATAGVSNAVKLPLEIITFA